MAPATPRCTSWWVLGVTNRSQIYQSATKDHSSTGTSVCCQFSELSPVEALGLCWTVETVERLRRCDLLTWQTVSTDQHNPSASTDESLLNRQQTKQITPLNEIPNSCLNRYKVTSPAADQTNYSHQWITHKNHPQRKRYNPNCWDLNVAKVSIDSKQLIQFALVLTRFPFTTPSSLFIYF